MVGHALQRCLSVLLIAATLGFVAAPAHAGPDSSAPVSYRPPVPGPVIGPFRRPANPYGPGNRGIDYATSPGDPVVAVAAGEVTFAGQVGGTLHVVVLHVDGIRTSLSFLASVTVRRGQHVVAGEVVGRSGAGLHLGARRGEEYIDPSRLLAGGDVEGPGGRVRLVPVDPARPLESEAEASGLSRLLGGLRRPVVGIGSTAWRATAPGAAATGMDAMVTAARRAHAAGGPGSWVVLAEAARAMVPQGSCTPASAAVPAGSGGARRLVLVAGLGSSSTAAAMKNVDAGALGYAADKVTMFSYRGGDSASTPYGSADTTAGIEKPAQLLRALLQGLSAADPATPIDIVAHSMGGLVTRAALVGPDSAAAVRSVVTLSTPHRGADLGGGARRLLEGPTAPAWRGIASLLDGTGLDMASLSVRQLAPGSSPAPGP